MKEVNLKNTNYRLIVGNVGFWINNNSHYLANPTDVSYYINKFGTTTVSDKELKKIDTELHQLWSSKIVPILNDVLNSDYIPSSEFKGTSYWQCAKTPYFGVNVLHSDKFIGQHFGIYELTRLEFESAMVEDRSPWAVQELKTDKYHFVGDANRNWMINLL